MAAGEPGIVIATPLAALERTLPQELLLEGGVNVLAGQNIDDQQLRKSFELLGYEPAEPVRLPGQYSQRGGIIDIFPTGQTLPRRIELFGDEVESIRTFDPTSQRSLAHIESLEILPSRETLYAFDSEDPRGSREAFAEMLERTMEHEAAMLTTEAGNLLRESITGDIKALMGGIFFDRLDLYRPLLHPDSNCAIQLASENGLIVLDEPVELHVHASRTEEELAQGLKARAERGEILDCQALDFVLAPEYLAEGLNVLAMANMGDLPSWAEIGTESDWEVASLQPYRGQATVLTQNLLRWHADGFTIVIATDQPTRARAMIQQIELFPSETMPSPSEHGVFLASGNLAGGFIVPHAKFALITDHELFGVGRLKLAQKRFSDGVPLATLLDLKSGDYVVHINFGIGVFRDLITREVDGVKKEYLLIEYAPPDKLYVPADQLDRIQKYLNPSDLQPKLNRLTGGEWQRTVGKAREEAREFARDLIRLYANRKTVQRQSYGPDTPWQGEMEATFPWVETPSQLAAIEETKRDLQNDYPMDRLVCGDVGFGKTEVAIRAAFKVAQAGKQVAVLCPTTILSEQHFRSFSERLAPFPTKIELVNRFRTASERTEIAENLKAGEVDIVIGTHALLSEQLQFKDLGLVIIDEEQKFGVKHKETLKKLRVNVDVLTLSATPIPRTLSMAMMDIRQMSLINDPPPGRLPIRTFVKPHSDQVIREALLRELARGGQVYYVYNRVTGLAHIADRLRRLVPTARIAVGHGQMTEKELEPVMLAFIKGEVDILLSTTIVESGLDIPNANTLIVENSDFFGLAQLYQLRGRVGRSDRQAYAYLLHSTKVLTDNAFARLQSLQEFSSLGSGYSLAFRDLQIRGAGDLLGAKQSGTIANVGYELFMQIIAEEVQFLKSHADGEGRDYRDPLEGLHALPTIDLPIAARIPETYVPDQAQRLYCYKQAMSVRSDDDLMNVRNEFVDRYGQLPEEVSNVFAIMSLRLQALELGIEKIDGNGGRLSVQFRDDAEQSPRVFSLLGKRNRECYLTRDKFIWPVAGSPIRVCNDMLNAYGQAVADVIAQREALSRG